MRLDVGVSNLSPPYTLPVPDPQSGYSTRYLGALLGVFLPHSATMGPVTADGAPYSPTMHRTRVHHVVNRKYFVYSTLLARNATAKLQAHYTVPAAAEVTSDHTMTYRLDVDPQDLVDPEVLAVSVTFPPGWSANSLPEGWTATADGARWRGPVATGLRFEIPLQKS